MYKHKLRIPYYMSKASDKMQLSYLIREMVWTSTLDFEQTSQDMEDKVWVLMNWDIDIKSMPLYKKEYSFETESAGYLRFYAVRDFYVKDGDEVLVQAKSLWTVIDMEKRSVAAMPESVKATSTELSRSTIKDYQFKLDRVELDQVHGLTIQNEDIDGNRHVSNAVYLKWFENLFDFDDYSNIDYKNIKIIYKKEILQEENIGYKVDLKADGALYEIINTDTDELKSSIQASF